MGVPKCFLLHSTGRKRLEYGGAWPRIGVEDVGENLGLGPSSLGLSILLLIPLLDMGLRWLSRCDPNLRRWL